MQTLIDLVMHLINIAITILYCREQYKMISKDNSEQYRMFMKDNREQYRIFLKDNSEQCRMFSKDNVL